MRTDSFRLAACCLLLAAAACGTDDSNDDPGSEPTGCEGFQPGDALEVPERAWTWVPIEGSRCRDGSATGIGVYRDPDATRLLIYLEAGGACFNDLTCKLNAANFDPATLAEWTDAGILDVTDDRNPFAGASVVYVPYCTGDVHGGSAEDVDVPGPGAPRDQQFVGHDNVARALARVVPTFAEVDDVVLAGVSAGAFGTWLNYAQVAGAFCEKDVVLLNDSGPALDEPYLSACLQRHWRKLWNFDETLPAACADCNQEDGGGIPALAPFLSRTWPEARFGMIASTLDATISLFFSFGLNECANLTAGFPPDGTSSYATGLLAFREQTLGPLPNVTTYFIPSNEHTWTDGETLHTTEVEDTPLAAWVAQLVEGPLPAPVGP